MKLNSLVVLSLVALMPVCKKRNFNVNAVWTGDSQEKRIGLHLAQKTSQSTLKILKCEHGAVRVDECQMAFEYASEDAFLKEVKQEIVLELSDDPDTWMKPYLESEFTFGVKTPAEAQERLEVAQAALTLAKTRYSKMSPQDPAENRANLLQQIQTLEANVEALKAFKEEPNKAEVVFSAFLRIYKRKPLGIQEILRHGHFYDMFTSAEVQDKELNDFLHLIANTSNKHLQNNEGLVELKLDMQSLRYKLEKIGDGTDAWGKQEKLAWLYLDFPVQSATNLTPYAHENDFVPLSFLSFAAEKPESLKKLFLDSASFKTSNPTKSFWFTPSQIFVGANLSALKNFKIALESLPWYNIDKKKLIKNLEETQGCLVSILNSWSGVNLPPESMQKPRVIVDWKEKGFYPPQFGSDLIKRFNGYSVKPKGSLLQTTAFENWQLEPSSTSNRSKSRDQLKLKASSNGYLRTDLNLECGTLKDLSEGTSPKWTQDYSVKQLAKILVGEKEIQLLNTSTQKFEPQNPKKPEKAALFMEAGFGLGFWSKHK
jgi:hypothetical protein